MPVYSAKSDTQYAASGPLPVPGPKLFLNTSPGCLWRPGDFLPRQYCLMLSMESMIAISSRWGGGGRQTFPVPLSRKILCYLSFLSCSRDPGRAVEDAARGTGNRRGGIEYYGCPCCGAQNFCAALRRTLEILTAATRSPRFIRHRRRSDRSPRARCSLAMTILKRSGVGGQGRPPLPTRSGNA